MKPKFFLITSLLIFLFGISLIGSLFAQENDAELASFAEIVENAAWSDNVTITINEEDATFTFESDGLPAEMYGGYLDAYIYKSREGDGIAPIDSVENNYVLPLVPELNETGEFETTNQGPIGIILSGVVLYNPYEGGGDTDIFAVEDNFEIDGVPFIDSCGGHPDVPQRLTFHYHGIPYCVTDVVDVEGEHSVLIGYALDAFPIYGPQDVDGEIPSDLNECSAHFGETPEFPDGIWHYHLTDERPYSIECYIGVVDDSLSGSDNGGQGGNNPPAGGNGGEGRQGNDSNPPPAGQGNG